MTTAKRLATIVVEPKKRHTASLFFFHGSGDTASGIRDWVNAVVGKELNFSHIKIIYPSAPPRPYTANRGATSTVWFDRRRIAPDVAEEKESLELACRRAGCLIDDEVSRGISRSRIVLGGFSMGGGLALHLGYRFQQELAGVFALSSFLSENSSVYQEIKTSTAASSTLPPLFACHGKRDPLVQYDWGKKTVDTLTDAGIKTEFHSFPNLSHEMNTKELHLLQEWIMRILPEQ